MQRAIILDLTPFLQSVLQTSNTTLALVNALVLCRACRNLAEDERRAKGTVDRVESF